MDSIPGLLIISGIIIIGLVLIFGIGVSETLPLFSVNDFDNVCDKYLTILSSQGCLTASDLNDFEDDINALGFNNVTITAPANAEWGSDVTLRVEAYYNYDSVNPDLTHSEKSKPCIYENSTRVFGIEN